MSQPRRILFAAEHCLADGSSGAAVSAVELLTLLGKRDWGVSALCGSKMDGAVSPPMGEQVRRAADGRLAVHHLSHRDIPIRILQPPPEPDAVRAALILLLEQELREARPDILLTYGGGSLGRAVLKTARNAGVPSVFWLRNTLYEKRDLFDTVTGGVIVPSTFTARFYAARLGLKCEVLYPTVLRDRVKCHVRQPKYLTFVTPIPEKGVYFIARLISELGRIRPDIEVLLVEGRGKLEWFDKTGLSVLNQDNVRIIRGAVEPRQFLAVTRLLAMPSLWEETFGRTVVEAGINGIPTIASNRGGIPEVVGTGGILLDVPERLASNKTLLASVAEVKPWLDQIITLWDDETAYRDMSRNAISASARFDPDVMADRADQLLRDWSTAHVQGSDEVLTPELRSAWSDLSDEASNLIS